MLSAYTDDPAVLDVGVRVLGIAALFQLFDGVQVVATGALRGTGETRIPMLTGVVGYWLVGLPVGWTLATHGGLGVVGLWIGLSIGLVFNAIVLVAVWARRIGRLART